MRAKYFKSGIMTIIVSLMLVLGLAFIPNKMLFAQGAGNSNRLSDAKSPDYAPGELIVKLKEGKTTEDLGELNSKYNVTSIEKVFKDTVKPEDVLKELKDKLSNLSSEHQSWYWQLDKNSQEYKDYMAKQAKEKEVLNNQIDAQEKLISKLEQRQKRSPEGASASNLDNIYVLKTDSNTDISAMDADYSAGGAVEYAEPN